MPHCFIGVDVIVGVRGERPEYFESALNFIESLDISQLHVFTYSERAGTQALKIDYVVDPKEKHRRSQAILEISERKLKAFYESQKGKTMKVLFEQPGKDKPMHGFTDNYVRVEAPFDDSVINQCGEIKLGDFNEAGDSLLAE